MNVGKGPLGPRVGLFYTRPRPEERALVTALEDLGAEVRMIPDRSFSARLGSLPEEFSDLDVVLLRSLSLTRNVTVGRILEAHGVPIVNATEVLEVCGDKFRTTLALARHGVPHVTATIAFEVEEAVDQASEMGYPVVVKPVIGSWGRLVGLVRDRDAAEMAFEHKRAIGTAAHQVLYMQPFVKAGNRDIRAFVVAGVVVAAIFRKGSHWRTNTALGAKASNCPLNDGLRAVSEGAAKAVGGGVVAVDLFETPDGYIVNEVNGTMEFRNSVSVTDVDIPGLVAQHVVAPCR